MDKKKVESIVTYTLDCPIQWEEDNKKNPSSRILLNKKMKQTLLRLENITTHDSKLHLNPIAS